ncbi:hypothetical protein J7T55_009563 [Diaporthe amygdali]|uniref:uncharacterized protein n=1 Tax=Phomopsis amygdali TaxID=1214568 RepID=UPI0022FF2EBA|nr:uncharacterized protein J7T55_009563 [Diaporthe amygdali]KAJ0109232.1 hypothetical protein J7T55_009563 [Diaporthe amygdali]
MKREADDEAYEGPAKRQLIDLGIEISTAEESVSQIGNDDATSLHTPSEAQTPPTVVSATSRASKRRNYPSEQKTSKCTWPGCPKTFNRPARLLAHFRSHTNERPYKCTYVGCDKDYTESKHLKLHLLSHTKEAKYVCETCDKAFATGTRLRRHQAVHEGQERFRCRDYPPCDQSFRKHQTLQRHVLKEHLGKKAFPCTHEGCGASYDTANSLRSHRDRDHGEIRFWCGECCEQAAQNPGDETKKPVGFTTQFLLDAHMRQDHVNCIFCDVRFAGHYLLEQHMEMYHSGLSVEDRKTVECTFPGCAKKFTKKANMNSHYRTAHEGKRFVCGKVNTFDVPGLEDWNWTEEGCGEGFVDKAKMSQHVLYVHLGRPRPATGAGSTHTAKAAGAGRSFLNEISGVANHERRQIVCTVPECAVRFIRYADLHNHVQAQHPEHADEVGLLGASEVPRLQDGEVIWGGDGGAEMAALDEPQFTDWGLVDDAGPEADAQETANWDREEANLMQLIDLDAAAIDPNLLPA